MVFVHQLVDVGIVHDERCGALDNVLANECVRGVSPRESHGEGRPQCPAKTCRSSSTIEMIATGTLSAVRTCSVIRLNWLIEPERESRPLALMALILEVGEIGIGFGIGFDKRR